MGARAIRRRSKLTATLEWIGIAILTLFAVAWWVLDDARAIAAEVQCGGASWYGTESGTRTANLEQFNGTGMTAAHKTLPFGTIVRVESQTRPGASIEVRINDRGPYIRGRIIDLSHSAARAFGMLPAGTDKVCLTVISAGASSGRAAAHHRHGKSPRKPNVLSDKNLLTSLLF